MMRYFKIAPEVFEQFPTFCVGVVVAKGVDNRGSCAAIEEMLARNSQALRERLAGTNVKEHPYIVVWREAFRKLGWNPNKFPSSIEAMTQRIVKGGNLPSINKVVNLANAVSLKYIIPMGAHDLDRTQGDIQIRFSREGDIFTPFGQTETESVEPGEIVYADDLEVRTRRWVWRQGEKAKTVESSRTLFFPVDGFSDVNRADVLKARDELADLLKEYLSNPEINCFFVHKDNPVALILP